MDYFYDGWMRFVGFKISVNIHFHYEADKSQDIFKITMIVFC